MPTDVETTSTELLEPAISAPAGGDPRTSASVRTPLGQLTNRARWLWARVESIAGKFAPIAGRIPKAITGADATADTLTLVGHGLSNNDPVYLLSVNGGTAPNPLSHNTLYFVIVVDADTIKLSSSSGPGAAVNLTGSLSGSVYIVKIASPLAWVNVSGVGWKTIQQAIDLIVSELATFASLTGNNAMSGDNTFSGNNTFSGKVTMSGTGGYTVQRESALNDSAAQTFTGTAADHWRCRDVSQNSTYTINDPGVAGESFVVSRVEVGGGFAALFKRADTTTIGRLPNTGNGWIRFVAFDTGSGVEWHSAEWGGDADLIA